MLFRSDEPCSALDPTSTRRIEQTIVEISDEVTVVIVTHNMQQAQRVSDNCAFFLAAQNTPGGIVEQGPTDTIFEHPTDHVPGMALLEAMRQAARCLLFPARLLPIGLASSFTRFVEFDSPCLVRAGLQTAGLDGESIIRVDLEQEGRACASGLVTVLPVERVVRRGTAD